MFGKLIVIDGIDGAGKTTQAQMLVTRLNESGAKSVYIHFPCYDTFFGGLVRRFLDGEFGTVDAVSPYLASVLYALDRWDMMDELREHLCAGTHVVLDRYISSNLAHQGAKMSGAKARQAFLTFARELEYERLGLIKEDVVLLLDTPPSQARHMMQIRGNKLDILENDTYHQEETYKLYLELARQHNHWRIIESLDAKGELRTKELVSADIWEEVKHLVL